MNQYDGDPNHQKTDRDYNDTGRYPGGQQDHSSGNYGQNFTNPQDPFGGNPYGQNPYQQSPYQQPRRYKEPGSSGMALASMILGACSFFLLLSGFSPVLGGLGILLALLSRGSGKMKPAAKAGLVASCIELALGTIMIAALSYVMFRDILTQDYDHLLDQYYHEYMDEYEDSYPDFYDELPDGLEELLPDDGYDDGNSFYFDGDWYGDGSGQPGTDGGLI